MTAYDLCEDVNFLYICQIKGLNESDRFNWADELVQTHGSDVLTVINNEYKDLLTAMTVNPELYIDKVVGMYAKLLRTKNSNFSDASLYSKRMVDKNEYLITYDRICVVGHVYCIIADIKPKMSSPRVLRKKDDHYLWWKLLPDCGKVIIYKVYRETGYFYD